VSDISVIAANHRVLGTISAAEDLIVQGRVEGKILSEATLVVDTQAIVEGEILARHVVIRGVVVGDVSGVEGIEVAPSGQVLGDLKTRRLALKAGGRVSGLVHTGIEVQGYSAAKGASAAAWQQRRPAAVATPPSSTAPRGWTEEIVETGPRPAVGSVADAKKPKKEPSRETL
jgi:cytoskeletal protein CcmA (bactofilin family)